MNIKLPSNITFIFELTSKDALKFGVHPWNNLQLLSSHSSFDNAILQDQIKIFSQDVRILFGLQQASHVKFIVLLSL